MCVCLAALCVTPNKRTHKLKWLGEKKENQTGNNGGECRSKPYYAHMRSIRCVLHLCVLRIASPEIDKLYDQLFNGIVECLIAKLIEFYWNRSRESAALTARLHGLCTSTFNRWAVINIPWGIDSAHLCNMRQPSGSRCRSHTLAQTHQSAGDVAVARN